MARKVLHVLHKWRKGWVLEEDGGLEIGRFLEKKDAVMAGQDHGRTLEQRGQDAQLKIHRINGSFETEYTYGTNPRPTSG
jgi:hypothetical protein